MVADLSFQVDHVVPNRPLLTLFAAGTVSAAAELKGDPAVERQFQSWLSNRARPDALKRGISAATLSAAFDGLALDWSLPDLAPPGARPGREEPQRQAEFSAPARYFNEARIAALATAGAARLAQLSKTLAAVEKRYGVPGPIVVAIWARESGYGAARLPYSAIRALATEAFMGARRANFYPEFLAALQIVDGDHISLADMKSSWAGALGQPQFLPSKYLSVAVDFDGDGKRDIWNSVPDTLASIANFLRQSGWKPGVPWGVEVGVPENVSCALDGPEQGKTLAAWQALGVHPLNGAALAARTPREVGHLLMPAGRSGPAFIVSDNFYVLKAYNNSDLYALFIGHLADRLRGAGPISAAWGDIGNFLRSDVRAMQLRLQARGVDVGNPDGLVGFKTRIAIGRWQEQHGRAATCFPDAALLQAIR